MSEYKATHYHFDFIAHSHRYFALHWTISQLLYTNTIQVKVCES